MKTFTNYEDAKNYADESGLPLWDTHQLPDRYFVGHLSAETEEDPDNSDWEQLQ